MAVTIRIPTQLRALAGGAGEVSVEVRSGTTALTPRRSAPVRRSAEVSASDQAAGSCST